MSSVKDYFTLFGLRAVYLQNKAIIKERFYDLQLKIHPDNFVNATKVEKRLAADLSAMINEGYHTLCSGLKRALYLLKLHGIDINENETNMPIDFLNHQMELRERMIEDVKGVEEEVTGALLGCEKKLGELLDEKPQGPALMQAARIIREMQFYERLSQEIHEYYHYH